MEGIKLAVNSAKTKKELLKPLNPTKLRIQSELSMRSSKIKQRNFTTPYLAGFYETSFEKTNFTK